MKKTLYVKKHGQSATLTYEGRCELIELKQHLEHISGNSRSMADTLKEMIPKRYVTQDQIRIWNNARELSESIRVIRKMQKITPEFKKDLEKLVGRYV
jgi:hypothetical protein